MSKIRIKIYRITRPHEKPAIDSLHQVLSWLRPSDNLSDILPAESEADGADYFFKAERAVRRPNT